MRKTPEIDYRRDNGFTLIELLITVIILTVFTTATITSLRSVLYSEQSTATVRVLAGWLDERRRQAIQSSEPCRISIDTDQATFSEAANNQCGDFATLYMKSELPGSNAISISLQNQTPNEWIFTPRGTVHLDPTQGNDDLELLVQDNRGDSSAKRCIKVTTPLGLVRSGRYSNNQCNYINAY